MKLKPLRQAAIIILTLGASLTLGLLSFTGMFVMWPILPLAIASFILAVAYEGEIFWQNLKGAFKSLLSPSSLKRQLFREWFLEKYKQQKQQEQTDNSLTEDESEYIALLQRLEQLEHTQTSDPDLLKNHKKTIKLLKKKIKMYEIIKANVLMQNKNGSFKATYNQRYAAFTLAKLFSLMAGAFVGMGTAYLLFEAFITLPFLAAVPVTILPTLILTMAGISAVAYALICYHSITAMINDHAIGHFIESIKNEFKKGLSLKLILKTGSALLFTALTITLTLCTAGTWWTIGQDLVFFVPLTAINVAVAFIGISTFFINFYNTICTWFGLKEQLQALSADQPTLNPEEELKQPQESWTLRANPMKWLIKIIMTPIDWTLFVAHVISIGVTGDQIPGVSKFVSTFLCSIDEFKEDWHRFFGHDHDHGHHDHDPQALLEQRTRMGNGHQHSLDLPRKMIQLTLLPAYLLASLWDMVCLKSDRMSWLGAWQQGWARQWSDHTQPPCKGHHGSQPVEPTRECAAPEHEHESKVNELIGNKVIMSLYDRLKDTSKGNAFKRLSEAKSINTSVLDTAIQDPELQKHRFGFFGKTHTQETLETLREVLSVG